MSEWIHRRINWEGDPLGEYWGIVCGPERPEGVESSMMASGYDCPDCVRQAPTRQMAANVWRLLQDCLEYGPRAAVEPLRQSFEVLAEWCRSEFGEGVLRTDWHYRMKLATLMCNDDTHWCEVYMDVRPGTLSDFGWDATRVYAVCGSGTCTRFGEVIWEQDGGTVPPDCLGERVEFHRLQMPSLIERGHCKCDGTKKEVR